MTDAGRSPPGPAPTGPPLQHAAFGNGRVLALVSPTGSIDWLCMPRFDSPSVFGRLLDEERGGAFRVLRDGREVLGTMRYVTNTNVVETTFRDGENAWQIVDYAPRIPEGIGVRVPIEIVRVVRRLAGRPRLTFDLDLRPDYARVVPRMEPTTTGIAVRGGDQPMHVVSNAPIPFLLGKREISIVEPLFFVLSYGEAAPLRTLASVEHELELTTLGWQAWSRTCALPSFAPEVVLRSALCLKLHAYHDTGAVIAAATTSIPEAMGTARTWDYRYCWLRDAAFVVEALRRLSHLAEGERFLSYLREVCEGGTLQPVYGIDGARELPEQMLEHLSGFRGNGHVRIGNAAASQRQNDLMGEMLLCIETLVRDPRIVLGRAEEYVPLVQDLVERAIALAETPDTGIWEFRTVLREHTFSRAMCWVAMHRGARLARHLGRHDLARRWDEHAARTRATFDRAYSSRLGFFTQALDGEHPDASNLLLPVIGIIDPRDPRFLSTLDQYEKRLVERGLMLRYRNPDDFGATTSAFTICSFWWAEALALAGRLEEAVRVFDRVVRYANPLGLFSEDVDPETGALLGNFPQAYTHVGLINAAITIGERLEARDGRVSAWGL